MIFSVLHLGIPADTSSDQFGALCGGTAWLLCGALPPAEPPPLPDESARLFAGSPGSAFSAAMQLAAKPQKAMRAKQEEEKRVPRIVVHPRAPQSVGDALENAQ